MPKSAGEGGSAMRYVLIGGGLASATAAEHIRKRDAGGEITIVGAEQHLPYHRPPLSEGDLRGEAEGQDTLGQPRGGEAGKKPTLLPGTKGTGGRTTGQP